MKIDIITCPQWDAKPPRQGITTCGKSKRIIFHHTDGHYREIENPRDESKAEAIRYAQDIQAFHMGPTRGWIDSGHNFLVCRNGDILQGRWLTVSAIEAGHMVISAHCPGQNDQIGIEHEHLPGEQPTGKQLNSSAELMAWIAVQYKLEHVLPVMPHRTFYNTSCPDNLVSFIPQVTRVAETILRGL